MSKPVLDDEAREIVAALCHQGGKAKLPSNTVEWRAAAFIERQQAQIMAAIALSYEGHASRCPKCGCLKCRIRHVLRGHTIDPDPVTIMRDELVKLQNL